MGRTHGRERLHRVLQGWRDGLVDLSGRNRLLNFRQTRSATLELREPGADELLQWPAQGWRFVQPIDEDGLDEPGNGSTDEAVETVEGSEEANVASRPERPSDSIVTQKRLRRGLEASLRKLHRDSGQIFNDTGLWVLQLGVGFLHWREGDQGPLSAAPLLLVPVQLERIGPGEYRLLPREDEEITPNPALAVKMQKMGLAWPTPEAMGDLPSARATVTEAVAGQQGWRVEDTVVMALFHSHKEAMYRDLLDNEERILDHPLVHAIALGADADLPDDALYFEPADLQRIDELQPPEDTPLVLDADSSQRQCVAAALAGRSFVMDGPPGTGKSQTIANIIAALMHAGKSVLFVSEKAAALDVVRNRLTEVGLGSFLLSLHSHHASRKEVAKELGAALAARPVPRLQGTTQDRDRLRQVRVQLSSYAAAMNEIDPNIERSVHDVIGRIMDLAHAPALSVPAVSGLTADTLHRLLLAADRAGLAWRPAAEGDDFAWLGLRKGVAVQPALRALDYAHGELVRSLRRYDAFTAPLGLAAVEHTERVIFLLDQIEDRPTVPAAWLSTADFTGLARGVDAFSSRLADLRRAEEGIYNGIGPEWDRLPSTLPSVKAPDDKLSFPLLTFRSATELAKQFGAEADLLRQSARAVSDIAATFGLSGDTDLKTASRLCELAWLCAADPAPDPAWLTPGGLSDAQAALADVHRAHETLRTARAAAADLFTEAVVGYDGLTALAARIADPPRTHMLSRSYREDRRALAALTVEGSWHKSLPGRAGQAVAWQAAQVGFTEAVSRHSRALGTRLNGEDTDFKTLAAALDHAARIVALAEGIDPTVLTAQCGSSSASVFAETAAETTKALNAWRSRLVPAPLPGGPPTLALLPLNAAASWYEAWTDPLMTLADACAAVESVVGSEVSYERALTLVEQVERHRAARTAFLDTAETDRSLLGAHYDGVATDLGTLHRAVNWTAMIRKAVGAMPPTAAAAFLDAQPDRALSRLHQDWNKAIADFTACFIPERGTALRAALLGPQAEQTLQRLRDDPSGPEIWHSHQEAAAVLDSHGFGGIIERAAGQGIAGSEFREALERGILEDWLERRLAEDTRLRPAIAAERDELVREFRRLDELLVETAYAQVIDACNARRPTPGLGQTATIQAEANKKKRHKPVRLLLEETKAVAPRLKPCFMMSPLTVSRFLPADYSFDVVIFDEASQVRSEDAINCVYRGRSLIVAGDQKQLPPTDFFGARDDADDEYDAEEPASFESLLDQCKASGLMRSLSLRWHYRSRHEDLITFSNRRFYNSELTTFPGSLEHGDDVGVTFTKVNGVYGRGRSQRNPVEAEEVARRVLHHYRTRPDLSLGVVAMSAAQASAIEDAVDEARRREPELEPHFTENRLDGFFVKSLETVQGDERDIIIISVGYGPDENGKLTLAFGPLNGHNGWRRLNVAATRARRRVEVVASISGADIPDTHTRLAYFKRYLDYAEHGPSVLEQRDADPSAVPESPFEESVLDVLTGWGYDVQPQVGVGSYRIDMAVRHPSQPGRYVLGIECDGAMYHSSRAARDRDRLREDVLRGLGWNLHRIWGTDWYRDQHSAESRLRAAVEAALHEMESAQPRSVQVVAAAPQPETAAEEPRVRIVEEAPEPVRAWAADYRQTVVSPVHTGYEMHVPEARPLLRQVMRQVIECEAPVSRDMLFRRAVEAWGGSKVGARIRNNLELTLTSLVDQHIITDDGRFLYLAGRPEIARRPAADGTTRKVADIAPIELGWALLGIIAESPGITADQLLTETCRFFGWSRLGSDIRMSLDRRLGELAREGRIQGYPAEIILHEA